MSSRKRFVVLSAARSGTSLLTSTLNSHPEIVCHGEIFHPRPKWHLNGTLADWPEERKIAAQQDVETFLDLVFDQPAPVVGFKMWKSQQPDVCARFLEDPEVMKIIYERENKLAQFSSGVLARSTGVWNLKARQKEQAELRPEPVGFNETAFRRFLGKQAQIFRFYRRRAVGPVLKMTYAQLTSNGFLPVLGFLGVAEAELTPMKRKLYSSDILGRFEPAAHDRLRAVLDEIGHPEWVEE